MQTLALSAAIAGLAAIAALPHVFFRRGTLNLAWWLTAAPFLLAGIGVLGVAADLLAPWRLGAAAPPLALCLAPAAIALIAWAARSHAAPVSLWHQKDDAPASLTTTGAYARIRHPFYGAFLLVLSACVLAAPHPITLLALLWAVVRLTQTARREERRLSAAFGDRYRAYMARTGRFFPV